MVMFTNGMARSSVDVDVAKVARKVSRARRAGQPRGRGSGRPHALAIAASQLSAERAATPIGHRHRKLDLYPATPTLDVRASPRTGEQVEVEEGLTPEVENEGTLLENAGPGPHLRQEGGDIGQQRRRAVGHGV